MMNIRGNRLHFYLLAAALLLAPAIAQAQFTVITNSGALVITGYTGPGGTVTIPGTSNGLPVTIGDNAFAQNSTLTKLILLNGVTEIGNSAFYNCFNLTSAVIPGSVINIGTYAFDYCESLTNIVISNGVVNIGYAAFQVTSARSMVIPGSVINVAGSAFMFCESLISVTISNGVQNIDAYAFSECYGLHSLNIPASVASIGEGAFEGCTGLTNIAVDGLNSNYANVSGVLFNKSLDTLVACPSLPNGSLSYVIPSGVTHIAPYAFALVGLTNVTVSAGVTDIGGGAFNACDFLPQIIIPGSVTNIGSDAFTGCASLTNITVNPSNPNYACADGVLFDKPFLTLIQWPTAKTGAYAIPNSVSNIASDAFVASHVTGVTIPDSVTSIGSDAFAGSFLANVTIPGNCNYMGFDAFSHLGNLTNVTILNGITNINESVFDSCYNLTTVIIPASVQSIGGSAFGFCTNLTNIYCLGNAPTVDPWAFSQDIGPVYYLPGTTGWTNTFGGLPTASWTLPPPVISNSGLAGPTNGFGFNLSWIPNLSVVVEASADLVTWQPVLTNTLSSSSTNFIDPQSVEYPGRFYRLRSPY